MLTIKTLIEKVGNAHQAESVLMAHYAAKQQSRYQRDRRYAAMEFALKFGPIFRRHAQRYALPKAA